ncbi:hypothetical protein WICPIJ_009302 [Wickerhamomyces pijperi]|uniref:Uncharacterized protein n=1 Tax=Wickerhamomyces pijperi TaxID=599730 RepID=A0A9P8PPI1_WICPI|nr:hypothetical protein WICPIJ_009302 [Wickerhamomyces pijperi]
MKTLLDSETSGKVNVNSLEPGTGTGIDEVGTVITGCNGLEEASSSVVVVVVVVGATVVVVSNAFVFFSSLETFVPPKLNPDDVVPDNLLLSSLFVAPRENKEGFDGVSSFSFELLLAWTSNWNGLADGVVLVACLSETSSEDSKVIDFLKAEDMIGL